MLEAACEHEPEFRALTARPSSRAFMVRAVEAVGRHTQDSLDEWIVKVTAHFLNSLCDGQGHTLPVLTTVAHEAFLLGECPRYDRSYIEEETSLADGTSPSEWLRWTDLTDASVTNELVAHYFIAHELTKHPYNLMRFEYPRRWVLMFLAVLAPELAARMTATRGGELRAEIEEEVTQRVQAALSHQLKRSAGAVRSHLKKIRSKMSPESFGKLRTEYDRILQESQFQIDLAERTGLWSAQPELRISATALLPLVEDAIVPLRERFSDVELSVAVPPTLRAHADAWLVREIVFCLVENACHAVSFAQAPGRKRVEVRGVQASQAIRLEVLDSGPGVHPDDRARIFEPRVTTKKGGQHQPLGTGMGLAIARRYARMMAGNVDIDASRPETCFYVELPRTATEEPA